MGSTVSGKVYKYFLMSIFYIPSWLVNYFYYAMLQVLKEEFKHFRLKAIFQL